MTEISRFKGLNNLNIEVWKIAEKTNPFCFPQNGVVLKGDSPHRSCPVWLYRRNKGFHINVPVSTMSPSVLFFNSNNGDSWRALSLLLSWNNMLA